MPYHKAIQFMWHNLNPNSFSHKTVLEELFEMIYFPPTILPTQKLKSRLSARKFNSSWAISVSFLMISEADFTQLLRLEKIHLGRKPPTFWNLNYWYVSEPEYATNIMT